MAVFLYNRATGEERAFGESEAASAIASGEWKGDAGTRVQLVDEITGKPFTTTAEQAEKYYLATGRAGFESGESLRGRRKEARLESEYGGLSGRGLLEAGARGLTLGLSDIALEGLGADEEGLRERRERGTGTTIAELTGALAPALFSGGTGLLGTAARLAPAGRAAAVGTSAAKAAGGGLRGLAAGGAVEGALFTAGQSVSDLALSDDPLTAEAIMAEAGDTVVGAALGAGAGLGLGLTGKFAQRVKQRSQKYLDAAASPAAIDAEIATAETGLARAKAAYDDVEMAAGRESFATREGTKARKGGRRSDILDLQAERKAHIFTRRSERAAELAATREATAAAREATAAARAGAKVAATEAKATGKVAAAQQKTALPSFRKSMELLDETADQTSRQVRKLVTPDGEGALAGSYRRFEEAQARFRSLAGDGSDDAIRAGMTKADEFAEAALDYERATFDMLDEHRAFQGKAPNGERYGIDDLYDASVSLAHHFEQAAAQAPTPQVIDDMLAPKIGRPRSYEVKADPVLDRIDADILRLKKANVTDVAAPAPVKQVPEVEAAGKAIEDQALVLRMLKDARAGKPVDVQALTDMLGPRGADIGTKIASIKAMASEGSSIGPMLSLLSMIPGGGMVGRGLRMADMLIGGTKYMAGARQAFHERVVKSVDGMIKAGPSAAKAASVGTAVGKSQVDRFQEKMDRLSASMGNPLDRQKQVWDHLAPVRAVSLPLAVRMIDVDTRKNAYLATKAPKSPGIGNALQMRDKWKPSPAQMTRYEKIEAVVNDPVVALERAAAGRLTMDDVDALRNVWPDSYESMRMEVITRVSELREELPYAKRVQLSVFFGVPVDSIMKPETVQAIQATHAVAGEGEEDQTTAAQQTGQRGGESKAANYDSVTPPEPTRAQSMVAA